MSQHETVTITIHVPRTTAHALQHQPSRLEAWLREVGLWPVQEVDARWRIDPLSQAMVATCEVRVAMSTEKEAQP